MSLSDQQWEFIKDVAKLITYADSIGYKLTGGELYRTEDQQWLYYNGRTIDNSQLIKAPTKSKTMNSQHLQRLAIDFNIFKNGVLTYAYNDVEPLGKYWVELDDKNRWGGDFNMDGIDNDSFKDTPHFERRAQ